MFTETTHQLKSRGFKLEILNSARENMNIPRWQIWINDISTFLRVLWGLIAKIKRSDLVFLNMSPYAALPVASSIWMISKLARRPMTLRFYGGSLSQIYEAYNPLARFVADSTFLRCPIVFVETQRLCSAFSERDNFRLFPNTRDLKAPATTRRDRVSKLLFLSQLRMEKGLGEALEACRALPKNCHLRVFGPPMPNTDFSLFAGHPRASYGGVLKPADVPGALCEHDLLLFPSYYTGEGYPGVILEAFQCGVPVVATRWKGIPELVQHEENGLLIEPRSAEAVRIAIERLLEDPGLYRHLCKGAKRWGESFRSTVWYDRIAQQLLCLT